MSTSRLPFGITRMRFFQHAMTASAGLLLVSGCQGGAVPSASAATKVRQERVAASPTVSAAKPVVAMPTVRRATPQMDSKLQEVAAAFKAFHEDTGGWPRGEEVWRADADPQLDPSEFTDHDTALFVKPPSLKQCGAETTAKPCWNGPYLTGAASLADSSMADQWGHTLMFSLIRPLDGMGGGAATAQNGAALVWSRGPDGRDGYGCIDGNCFRDDKKIAVGEPSEPTADDPAMVVGTTR